MTDKKGMEGNQKNDQTDLPMDGKLQPPGDSNRPFTVVEKI